MIKRLLIILACVTIMWLALGGPNLQDPTVLQQRTDVALPLDAPVTLTFMSGRSGLSSIAVRAETPDSDVCPITYQLSADGQNIGEGCATAGSGEDQGWWRIGIASYPEHSHVSYQLRLTSENPGARVYASAVDVLNNIEASRAGQPIRGDLAIKLHYRYGLQNFIDDIIHIRLHSAFAVLALLLLPGLAVVMLFSTLRNHNQGYVHPAPAGIENDSGSTWLDSMTLSVGISIALAPIGLLIVTVAGLHVSPTAIWVMLLVCLIIVVTQAWRLRRVLHAMTFPVSDVAMLGLFAAGLIMNLAAAREISYPLWTDSNHHSIITQLIIEQGQIPDNYLPYFTFDRFTYHFGFHALAAYIAQLANLSTPQAVVLTGQLLNSLTGLTLYAFVARISHSRSLAFWAAATVTLLNHVPGFYVNWGRYPQLAGVVLLPLTAMAIIRAAREGTPKWIICAGVLSAGLFLVHYRMAFMALLLVTAVGAANISVLWKISPRIKVYAIRIALTALVAMLLAGPWLLPMAQRMFIPYFLGSRPATAPVLASPSDRSYSLELLTSIGLSPAVIALALLGLVWGLRRRQKLAQVAMLWAILLFLGANTNRVLGRALYDRDAFLIMLFLPAGMLAAYALNGAWNNWHKITLRWKQVNTEIGLSVVIIAFTALASARAEVARLDNGFVRASDIQAIEWVAQNTPPDARFAIGGEFWLPSIVEGRDAGWWLPMLAHRQVTIPTMVYVTEVDGATRLGILNLARDLNNLRDPAAALPMLRANGIGYIYVGNRPTQVDPMLLTETPGYRLLYYHEGAWVFGVE